MMDFKWFKQSVRVALVCSRGGIMCLHVVAALWTTASAKVQAGDADVSINLTPVAGAVGWWDEVVGHLLGVIAGVVIAIVTIRMQLSTDRKKEKDAEADRFMVVLSTAAREIRFYRGKLTQLSAEIVAIVAPAGAPGAVSVPSYSLHTGLLEGTLVQISEFNRSAPLVEQLSECYFELAHVSERLEEMKRALTTTPPGLAATPVNLQGFSDLVENAIVLFDRTSSTIEEVRNGVEEDQRVKRRRLNLSTRAEEQGNGVSPDSGPVPRG